MSISIKTIDLKSEEEINYRSISLSDKLVQSVNINQTDGTFITTEPLNNKFLIYPQSPNNPRYSIKSYEDFIGYGNLDFPLDARFDYLRNKVFVADAGNNRVLKINTSNYSIDNSFSDIILPHSVIPEINLGGVFIKAFSGISTGIIYYYGINGKLEDYFTYPCDLGHTSTSIEYTENYVKSLPLPSSMVYDHVRWRLWWTADSFIYMLDVRNKQVIEQDLRTSYVQTRGIDVELKSGNAFVVVKDLSKWKLIQVFRDNNYIIGEAYVNEDNL